MKLHTLLDLRGSIPSVVIITSGKIHDIRILDQFPIESGAIYVVDRCYIDFSRLYRIHQVGAFFVTRAKSNFQFRRLYSQKVESKSILCDKIIVAHNFYEKKITQQNRGESGIWMPILERNWFS